MDEEISPANTENCTQSTINDTLQLVLEQLKSQKEELSSLRDDVKGNNHTLKTEVKKLKVKELSWKSQGKKIQHEFNYDIQEGIEQAKWAIKNCKPECAQEVLDNTSLKIHNRNKDISIADTREEGWETARQYKSNPIASNSEDESKIYKADKEAVRKRKRLRSRSKQRTEYNGSRKPSAYLSAPNLSSGLNTTWNANIPQWGSKHSNPGTYAQQGASNFRLYTRKPNGSCFACGDFSHIRRYCPYASEFNNRPRSQTTVATSKRE